MDKPDTPVIDNPWASLRRFTAARIALGRSGVSQPTAAQLQFQLDHARARDAVHHPLDTAACARLLDQHLATPVAACLPGCLTLASAAATRTIYLQRPDLGRRLADASAAALSQRRAQLVAGAAVRAPSNASAAAEKSASSIALVFADGLSARAIEHQALPFFQALLPLLAKQGWHCLPVCVVSQGRVAIGDEIGALLGADVVAVMIGERPGLSSPDSMGIYLTWAPRPGLTDERRNCISNVRPAGLPPAAAAAQLASLLEQARRQSLSGVALRLGGQQLPAGLPGTMQT